MAKDTLTLALNGDVGLAEFAQAILQFRTLVDALSKELGVADDIRWYIHDLQVGSTIATVRGETDSPSKVERVVTAYGDVGVALQSGTRPSYSDPVVNAARAITQVLNGHISSVRFETADTDAIVKSQAPMGTAAATAMTIGAVEGRVQTLTSRKGLRFTLYDVLHDRAVSCYLRDDQEESMRPMWGKRAIVEGEISREKDTGRPVAIRRIRNFKVLPESQPGMYMKARGVAPMLPGAALPEIIIRRLRDE